MRALTYREYGGPERLKIESATRPEPGDREVLVQVLATALNASDVEFLAGSPAYVRMWGLRRPRYRVLGSDVAGRVVAVGRAVTRFRPGDAVFGDLLEHWGGLAEFVLAPEARLSSKPDGLSFDAAAAIPQAGVLALQCLRASGGPTAERVLLNGGGGGAGTFAIQLAKLLGAREVTAVDHTEKLARMRDLGADRVIDYTRADFTSEAQRYDRIIDFVASRPLRDCARALAPGGIYLVAGGSLRRILAALLIGTLRSALGSRRFRLLSARQSLEDLDYVAELCSSGRIVPVVQRDYALEQAPEAFRELGAGRVFGKVVVTL